MDCKNLMIGDWVDIPQNGVGVRKIDIGDMSFFNEFSPIPITAEILEKNGWSKEEIPARYQCGVYVQYISPNGRVIASHFDTNSKEWGVHLDNDHFSTVGYFECDYVHELQHALRLCGLNELADNFKV